MKNKYFKELYIKYNKTLKVLYIFLVEDKGIEPFLVECKSTVLATITNPPDWSRWVDSNHQLPHPKCGMLPIASHLGVFLLIPNTKIVVGFQCSLPPIRALESLEQLLETIKTFMPMRPVSPCTTSVHFSNQHSMHFIRVYQ